MKRLGNERGIVLVVALAIVGVLAALSLAVATSGQMSTVASALSAQATAAFQAADGAAWFGVSDPANFVPGVSRSTDLAGSTAALDATVSANYLGYRTLPGNLVVRTSDGNVRAAQFGQAEGLGRLFTFRLEGRRKTGVTGVDAASTVVVRAARIAPCADCGG